jgi:hypothetical protein
MNKNYESNKMNCDKTYDVKVIDCGAYAYVDNIGHSNKCFYLCLLYFLRYEIGNFDIKMDDLFTTIFNPNYDESGMFNLRDETIEMNLNIFLILYDIRLTIFAKNHNDNIEKIDKNKIKYKIYDIKDGYYDYNNKNNARYWLKLFNTGYHYQIIDSITPAEIINSIELKNNFSYIDEIINDKSTNTRDLCFITESQYIDSFLKDKIMKSIDSCLKDKIMKSIDNEEYNNINKYLNIENFNNDPLNIINSDDIKFFINILNDETLNFTKSRNIHLTGLYDSEINRDINNLERLKHIINNYKSVSIHKSIEELNIQEIKNRINEIITNFKSVSKSFESNREKKKNFNDSYHEISELLKNLYLKNSKLRKFNGNINNIDEYLYNLSNYLKDNENIINQNNKIPLKSNTPLLNTNEIPLKSNTPLLNTNEMLKYNLDINRDYIISIIQNYFDTRDSIIKDDLIDIFHNVIINIEKTPAIIEKFEDKILLMDFMNIIKNDSSENNILLHNLLKYLQSYDEIPLKSNTPLSLKNTNQTLKYNSDDIRDNIILIIEDYFFTSETKTKFDLLDVYYKIIGNLTDNPDIIQNFNQKTLLMNFTNIEFMESYEIENLLRNLLNYLKNTYYGGSNKYTLKKL